MKSAEAEGLLQPASKRGYMWTTTEVNIVRQLYGTQGPQACLALLPGRTLSGVYQQARKLGIDAPSNMGVRRSWGTTPELDARIVSGMAAATGRNAVARLARTLDRPAWWVSRRAITMGLTPPRFREPEWTKAELEILEGCATLQRPESMARRLKAAGFTRSPTACIQKAKRMKYDRTDHDQWSATGLGVLMGIDGKTVVRWIEREGLPAKRAGTDRTPQQGGDEWRIARPALRNWIRTHAQLVDLRKVDRYWFIELAFGGAT